MSYLDERRGHILNGRPLKTKAKKPIPKKSAKRIAKEKAEREERGDDDTDLQKWFKNRHKQLAGVCLRCGAKHDITTLRAAIPNIAHVLPKRDICFPSVKYHPDNYIELGASCGCHKWLDEFASWEEIAQDKIWPVALEKFLLMEPHIQERAKIPEVFRQEIRPKI